MKPKYKIGDKLWTPAMKDYVYHAEQCTIERIEKREDKTLYKMVEGCSYYRGYGNDMFDTREEAEKVCEEINKQILEKKALREKADKFWELINRDRFLRDGIYDVTNIPFYQLEEDDKAEKLNEVKSFIDSNPDYTVAHAYETYTIFILAREPNKLKGHSIGSGFNYGSTNIIQNCPKDILILAEDD